MSGKYEDIINLPHHISDRHARMSMLDRAAQFLLLLIEIKKRSGMPLRFCASDCVNAQAARKNLTRKMADRM